MLQGVAGTWTLLLRLVIHAAEVKIALAFTINGLMELWLATLAQSQKIFSFTLSPIGLPFIALVHNLSLSLFHTQITFYG